MSEEDLREELAALEHDQWAHWTKYMLEVLREELESACLCRGVDDPLPSYFFENFTEEVDDRNSPIETLIECVNRWRRQIETPYADLTEKEKNSDREWADKVLAIVNSEENIERLAVELHPRPIEQQSSFAAFKPPSCVCARGEWNKEDG